jgi:hypothetical protein
LIDLKVLVPISDTRSGHNVYFDQLKQAVACHGVSLDLIRFARHIEIAPALASSRVHAQANLGNYDVLHVNADYGSAFKCADRPFVVTVLHNVFEDIACDILSARRHGYVGEAMACAQPIVCTNASALPELVLDEKGGFLCRLADVDDFVERIRFLGARPALRQSMGEFNRQRIENHFTMAQMGMASATVYQSLLSVKREG